MKYSCTNINLKEVNNFLGFFKCVLFIMQDSSQIELLKELMDLQKDMVVMLLSMLEGSESLI